jgi:hypothetical protein
MTTYKKVLHLNDDEEIVIREAINLLKEKCIAERGEEALSIETFYGYNISCIEENLDEERQMTSTSSPCWP